MVNESAQIDITGNVEVKGHRLAHDRDKAFFEDVMGTGISAYLSEIGAPLLVDENKIDKPSKNSDAGSRSRWEELGLIPTNYTRTDFATLIDGRAVWFAAFKKIDGAMNGDLPDRVAQIDFMFKDDWESGQSIDKAYASQKNYKEVGGAGLYSDAALFLRKVQKLAQKVDSSCTLQVCASDKQREKIYKIALKGMSNVRFIDRTSDIPYHKYSS